MRICPQGHRFEERIVSACPFCETDIPLVPQRPPRPWVSFVLSTFIFGGGQFYNGRKARGILTFVGVATGVFGAWYGAIEFGSRPESGTGLILAGLVLAVPVWLFSLADAYEDAIEIGSGMAALTERNPRVAGLLNLLPRAWGFGYVYNGRIRLGLLVFGLGFVATLWAGRGGLAPLASLVTLGQIATAIHAYVMAQRELVARIEPHRGRLNPGLVPNPWVFRLTAGLLVLFELALVFVQILPLVLS